MIEEWSATLTLTEASSKELMRILKEQDEAFINNLFNGKCGFTLTSTDGRSVELVPKIGQTEPQVEHTPTNVETMSCQECKWHFTDGNESYCQRDYYDMPCKYEERR